MGWLCGQLAWCLVLGADIKEEALGRAEVVAEGCLLVMGFDGFGAKCDFVSKDTDKSGKICIRKMGCAVGSELVTQDVTS